MGEDPAPKVLPREENVGQVQSGLGGNNQSGFARLSRKVDIGDQYGEQDGDSRQPMITHARGRRPGRPEAQDIRP